MKRTRDSASASRRTQVLTFIAGWGSLFDLWPAVKYEEVYPHKADEILRRSLDRVAAAHWTAFSEVTGEQEEGQANAQALGVEAGTGDEPVGGH